MIVRVEDWNNVDPFKTTVRLRCPACNHLATFSAMPGVYDVWIPEGAYTAGQRHCPNPDCLAHVFFVLKDEVLVASYPAQRIDFDASDVPDSIVASIDEALTCHANRCYVAAAIMVRKTLEDVCRDRGATGPNLKERIKALGSRVVLPAELLEAVDDLRLLGNDAAHVESSTFNEVGRDEVEAALAVAKELLKGVYQYAALVRQLRALKRTSS